MLETGGILIVMGAIFAVGAAGEWILSLFYRRYLRDTADMGRPGKKLVKLTKLRYETSYYLNGTVHNAKTMVDGMLEHYRLAGLRLWTWHHMATTAAFLCGTIGFAIGGAYVAGRYIAEVKEAFPLSGMNALIYTLAGVALAAMLLFWQNLLDNRTKRSRLESNLVDYFDNEKFHQLGREIALSGRVREIAGDRGRREDPGSAAAETQVSGPEADPEAWDPEGAAEAAGTAVGSMEGAASGSVSGTGPAAKASGKKTSAGTKKTAAKTAQAAAPDRDGEKNLNENSEESGGERPDIGFEEAKVRTIGDIISQGEVFGGVEPETDGNASRGRSVARKKTASSSTRARAKNVQIAQEEMEERKASGNRKKGKIPGDVIIPLNPKNSAPENRAYGEEASESDEPGANAPANGKRGVGVTENTLWRSSEEADELDKIAEIEAAATAVPATQAAPQAKRRRTAGKSTAASGTGKSVSGTEDGTEVSPEVISGDAGRAAREEELLRLLREYMGL